MPKMKTRRGAAKRFKVRASGKIAFGHVNRRHLLECKGRKRKRQLRATGHVAAVDAGRIARQLPYA